MPFKKINIKELKERLLEENPELEISFARLDLIYTLRKIIYKTKERNL